MATFIDAFAGAGGLSLGMANAGLNSLYAFDLDELSCQTHRRNLHGEVEHRNIYDIDPRKLVKRVGTPDVVVGGPPCQGFSTQRRGSPIDSRNDLVTQYFRFALAVRPRVIAMENVPGVLGTRGRSHMMDVFRLINEHGYDIIANVVDAASFGVPQHRRRAVVVAWDPSRAKPFDLTKLTDSGPVSTVRDAIGDLPSPPIDFTEHQSFSNHTRVRMSARNLERISYVPQGGGRLDVPERLWLPCHRTNRHRHLDVYGRLSWDRPAGTITAMFDNFTRGRFAHPAEDRNITNREGARLQTFPDWYVFVGPKKDVARQIGNAVPPLLAEVVGRQIIAQLKT
jgi:DNA (cytosine-5)-methyltransferase 1